MSEFTVSEIKELIKAVQESKIAGLVYETQEFKLKIDGKKEKILQSAASAPMQQAPVVVAATAASQGDGGAEVSVSSSAQDASKLITSPIVGTYYNSPAPDQEPFVEVGQHVGKGDVVFIIESMKVMNEVPSEFSGTVAEILVQNGQAVEFGQPILRLE
ncbi:acetyl-CoA carboxylase biotin carboxyl carrier protein [Youxingia wuxianensis]|uniref:Biotin carboxyl carrier protein of acetyl-CoA carboxylase n=1 Tax=Youxingia wuxianensis TaxID=2763678 RepID=A0A926II83_9FIRM|nr:acetyl-CoA carboxylase biotin carboxyl carrier protein [Youxingia wuxianensis]MBC8585930.1 acetyl-CoA carboxylase biotin carboxyl carrier protein [Youxingia wuxianensis]